MQYHYLQGRVYHRNFVLAGIIVGQTTYSTALFSIIFAQYDKQADAGIIIVRC